MTIAGRAGQYSEPHAPERANAAGERRTYPAWRRKLKRHLVDPGQPEHIRQTVCGERGQEYVTEDAAAVTCGNCRKALEARARRAGAARPPERRPGRPASDHPMRAAGWKPRPGVSYEWVPATETE